MKRLWIAILSFLLGCGIAYGASVYIGSLTADTSPTSDDLIETENDPGGTPASRKVTLGNAITKAHGLTGNGYAIMLDASNVMQASDLSAVYQPLEATLTDIADGTITENLVNTANPWADNEVADDITLTNITQIGTRPITSLTATNWRLFYSAGGGVPVELALGADGTFLESNGAAAAPAFRALLYSDLTAFSEANLYTILSDVSMFLEDLVDDTTPQLGGHLDFNNKVLYDDWTAFTANDTTPNVSAGSFFKTANSGATTIADFDDTDDHGDFQDGRLLFVYINDANTTLDFTSSELEWASQGANDYTCSTQDVFIFQYDSARDAASAGWRVVAGPMPSVVSISSLTIPWGDADATLDSGGDIHFNETDEQIGIHSGDSGEISGEVALSVIQHFSITFDPKVVCDGTIDRLFLFTVGDDAPEGITIDEWKLSFEADPGTEFAASQLHLKRADAMIGVANAAEMDDLATTAGVSSEDTDASINGGAVVANGQVIYLQFDSAYTETGHQVMFELWYHMEED